MFDVRERAWESVAFPRRKRRIGLCSWIHVGSRTRPVDCDDRCGQVDTNVEQSGNEGNTALSLIKGQIVPALSVACSNHHSPTAC